MTSLPRPRATLTVAAAALSALVLSSCGSDRADEGRGDADPRPTAGASPTASPADGPVTHTELDSFSVTRLRVEEGTVTPLEAGGAQEWLTDAAPSEVVDQADAAVSRVPDGSTAYGLVLAVGCDAPAGYSLARVDGELTVRVEKPSAATQCLAPTTFLAVVAVDETD